MVYVATQFSAAQVAVCKNCNNACGGLNGYRNQDDIACTAFGENEITRRDGENVYRVIKVGTEKGSLTEATFPGSSTINTNGHCERYNGVSFGRKVLRELIPPYMR